MDEWQDDIEFATLGAPFQAWSTCNFRPNCGATIDMELTHLQHNAAFSDLSRFPLARMIDSHELLERDAALEVRTTITHSGPLAFL
ncbi:MAG: hypothetical protein ABIT20_00025 [Gemmatimonadaceae bacterium]